MIEWLGYFVNASQDWKTGKWNITFACDEESILKEIDSLKDAKLDITAKKHRNKRSHDANAYAWVLMQKIAELAGTSKWDVYLEMLKRYSRAFTHIICKPSAVEQMKALYRTTIDLGEVTVGDMTGHQLQVYFGSSTFDTKEMAVFIDGIVSECQMLGIQTETPAELERMKSLWDVKKN